MAGQDISWMHFLETRMPTRKAYLLKVLLAAEYPKSKIYDVTLVHLLA